jgi:CRISPR-associated protein Cmr5
MSRSLDQQRADHAWQQVEKGAEKERVNLAKGAPALIMANGLMQALAFYQSKALKGRAEHKWLLDAILGWLSGEGGVLSGAKGFKSAMERMHKGSSDLYMRATEEALAYLRWLRQLAAANEKKGG